MENLLSGLKTLGVGRLAALAAVAVATLGLLTLLAMQGGTSHMSLLYADLDLREAGQIADVLDRQKIPHQLGAGGSEVLVPDDMVAKARLVLAREGLPSGGSIGYEIFDRGDNITANAFQQAMNQTRAMEGELARSIRAIQGVRAVRVHLVLPHREPFARDRQEAQAAVELSMQGAARLDQEGVRAILNLVAAAVPGLRTKNIAIVDTRGNLLARAGEPVGPSGVLASAEEQRRAAEIQLSRAVEEMLERSLGPGHVRAEASISYDYDQVHETQEHYDPDGQVVRSQQNVTSNSKSTEAANTVSVQNNLPNADAGGSGAGTQEQRQEETTNYEIAKTVRTIVRDQPKIARLSLAVMVDGVTVTGADGKASWQERPSAELDRIARLVRSAIGFDEKRGDTVEVASLRFVADPDQLALDSAPTLLLGLEKADLMRLAQLGLFGVIGIVTLLLVLRPMVRRLTIMPALPALAGGEDAGAAGSLGHTAGIARLPGGTSALSAEVGAGSGLPALAGPPGAAALEDDSMVNVVNVEGQLRASSIRRLSDLVEKHPDESLSIVRAWLQQEPA